MWYGLAVQALKSLRAPAGLKIVPRFKDQEDEVWEDFSPGIEDDSGTVRKELTDGELVEGRREVFTPKLQKSNGTFPKPGESEGGPVKLRRRRELMAPKNRQPASNHRSQYIFLPVKKFLKITCSHGEAPPVYERKPYVNHQLGSGSTQTCTSKSGAGRS